MGADVHDFEASAIVSKNPAMPVRIQKRIRLVAKIDCVCIHNGESTFFVLRRRVIVRFVIFVFDEIWIKPFTIGGTMKIF